MKKINIKAYNVLVTTPDGSKGEVIYAFKESIIEMLFSPTLKLKTIDLLKQEILAKKIIESKGDELLVEEEEYSRIKKALEQVEGLSKNDIELVHRILEAEEIEVESKS